MNLEKQIEDLFKLSADIRGTFLDQSIMIERLIDDIIAKHFCAEEEKRILLFSLITSRFSFQSRIMALKTVLECCYPQLFEKHRNTIKNLQQIREFRNKIAHSMIDSSIEFLEKKYNDRIRLVVYGKEKHIVIKKDDMKKRLSDCSKAILALNEIQIKVIKSPN